LAEKLAEHQKLIYSPAQLEDVKKKIRLSGEKNHTIYTVSDSKLREWTRKKLLLYGVNLPAMIAIPAFIEFGDLEAIYDDRAETVMMVLSGIDLFFFAKSYMLYTFLQKLVTHISYNPETNKLTVH